MFDVGWQELALTGVVALLVLGPKELPGLMRTAGQLVRKARLVAHDFRLNLEEMAEIDELEEYRRNAIRNVGLDPDEVARNPAPPAVAATAGEAVPAPPATVAPTTPPLVAAPPKPEGRDE